MKSKSFQGGDVRWFCRGSEAFTEWRSPAAVREWREAPREQPSFKFVEKASFYVLIRQMNRALTK
ncbi:MAG: hypothetical protein EBS01_05450 [Verrucomicrobia bacterium]|nr:hypothetical protein [Verrucomicrobiota bacterium]